MHHLIAKDRLRQVLLILGIVGLCIAARMTWKFGSTMTTEHGLLLVGVTLLAGVIFAAREIMVNQRDSIGSYVALVAGALFLTVELFSHIGYTVGMRTNVNESAEVQNTRYDDTRDVLKTSRETLASTKQRLTTIETQHPWLMSTTAASLQALIPSANKAIELETARGGCKTVCKQRMDEKGELLKRIALAEEAEGARRLIMEGQTTLASVSDKSAKTAKGDSTVRNQTFWVSQIAELSLTPGVETRTGVEIGISFLLAIAGVCFAPTCLWLWARLGIQLDEAANRMTVPAKAIHTELASMPHMAQAMERVEVRNVGEGAPRPVNGQSLSLSEVHVPVKVTVDQIEGDGFPEPKKRITRVRENAFARRVSEVTALLRSQRAA